MIAIFGLEIASFAKGDTLALVEMLDAFGETHFEYRYNLYR